MTVPSKAKRAPTESIKKIVEQAEMALSSPSMKNSRNVMTKGYSMQHSRQHDQTKEGADLEIHELEAMLDQNSHPKS